MKIIWQRWMESVEDRFEEEVDFEDEDGEVQTEIRSKRPFVITPMGVIPDDWNFWLGHTDFRITEDEGGTISNTDGVESFEVGSPYRFRISIGKAFDSKQVKLDIQRNLGIKKAPLEPEIRGKRDEIIKTLKNPYWAIYMTPTGEADVSESEQIEEIYEKLDIYEHAKDSAGGYVFSWKSDLGE